MPTAQDILQTLVKLEGVGSYVSGMSQLSAAQRKAAESQLLLIANQRKFVTASAALAGAASVGIGYMVKQASAFEAYRNKLEIATKSTEKANRIFEAAKQYANVTPFDTGAVVDAAARLEMYGMTAAKWLPLAGDMAGAMSRDITQAVEAIADAISGGGLERLKEFGIGSMQLKQAGWTGSYQDQKGIETLKKALTDLISDKFMGGAERMSTTLTGKLSTMRGEFDTLAAEIGSDLLPTFGRLVDGGINIVRMMKGIGPEGRRMIGDLMSVGAVAGVVGIIVGKYKMWQTQQAIMRLIAQQTAVANQEEAAAVNGAAAAYDRKAASQAKAASAAQASRAHPAVWDSMDDYVAAGGGAAVGGAARGGGFFSRPKGGIFGKYGRQLRGTAGMIQQTAGFTMAAVNLGRIDWGGDWSAASDNVADLAKAAGYAAGAFNPLMLAATGAADALGGIIDAWSQRKLEAAEKEAAIPAGFNPDNTPMTRQQIAEEYERRKAEGITGGVTRDEYIRSIESIQRRVLAAREAEAVRKKNAEDLEAALATADVQQGLLNTRTGVAKRIYDDMLSQSKSAMDLVRNYEALQRQLDTVTAAMQREAKQHEATATLLTRKANATTDATERSKLLAEAEKELAQAGQLQAESTAMQRDLTKELNEARKELAEEARRSAKEASEKRIREAESRTRLIETVYGEESEQARVAYEELARLYAAEAQQALALGEVAEAHDLARQAVEAHRASQETLTKAIERSLDIGGAYAEYLESLGRKEEADAYKRQSLAQTQARLAQQYFAQGDIASGYRAAAAAERLARTGLQEKDKDKRAGFISGLGEKTRGGDVFGGRAVTDALNAPVALQAANRQPVVVRSETKLVFEEGFVDRKRIRADVNRANYYEAMAQ